MGVSLLPEDLLLSRSSCLVAARDALAAGDELLTEAFAGLRARAEEALSHGPFSVVDDALVPPSGDKHDYLSVGPYWWPDPAKPDGLPYIRRDGEVNPERNQGDAAAMGKMNGAVKSLALAYWLTNDERYAEHAAHLLRVWFLDEATRMNPHLEYAQAIPGRCAGRGIGIIDTTGWIELPDRVVLLARSPHWSSADHEGLQRWFDAYLEWLLTSKHGRDERAAVNNHGTWYDAQVAAFALFVGHHNVAADILSQVGDERLARQVEPDGSQPHELARTKSWGYSVFNLTAYLDLARLGEHVGVDLWHFQTVDGRSLRTALDFLVDHLAGTRRWLYPQLGGWHPEALLGPLLMAAHGLDDTRYFEVAAELAV
jgi:hypothetical protein